MSSPDTIGDLSRAFDEAIRLASDKNTLYRDAWRQQGWRGNLARILSKADRLRAQLWRDNVRLEMMPADDEGIERQLLDIMNMAGFMLLNFRQGRQWGNEVMEERVSPTGSTWHATRSTNGDEYPDVSGSGVPYPSEPAPAHSSH